MERKELALLLIGLGLGIALSWIVEAIFVGRGVVSTYLGPVSLLAIISGLFVGKNNPPK
jgi:hypothetical protein